MDLLKLADGDVIFEEKGHYVCTKKKLRLNQLIKTKLNLLQLTQIVNLIDDSIKAESERLLQLHQSKYIKNSRLILQVKFHFSKFKLNSLKNQIRSFGKFCHLIKVQSKTSRKEVFANCEICFR